MTDTGSLSYIFSGSQYYVYVNMVLAQNFPRSITENWGLPDNLDAAFQWSKNGLTYFIKGMRYFVFNTPGKVSVCITLVFTLKLKSSAKYAFGIVV